MPVFNNQVIPMWFEPKPYIALNILIKKAYGFPSSVKNPDPYLRIKFAGRDEVDESSQIFHNNREPVWNQFFSYEIRSLSTDILEIYIMDKNKISKDSTIGVAKIPISYDMMGITKEESILIDKSSVVTYLPIHIDALIQISAPGQIPFTDSRFYPDILNVKFLEGSNLSFGDPYCQCRLSDDITWRKTRAVSNAKNPQWNEIIMLPLIRRNQMLDIEVKNENLVHDTEFGKCTVNLGELGDKTVKMESNIGKGKITYLVQIGKSGTPPFEDFNEEDEKVTSVNPIFSIKVIEARDLKASDCNSSDPYCKLVMNGIEKNTKVIDSNLNPFWNQTFHFDITSFMTNELILSIFDHDKMSKDDLLGTLKLKLSEMECGVVKDTWYNLEKGSIHLQTHISAPGQYSFDPYPFMPVTKLIRVENVQGDPNNYVSLKLQGDEYCRYTPKGNFKKVFPVSYIDTGNNRLVCQLCSSMGKEKDTQTPEVEFDVREDGERMIENELGKVKITIGSEPIRITKCPNWTLNFDLKEITNIKKKKDRVWFIDFGDGFETEYTYNGIFDVQFQKVIISLGDEIPIKVYKKKNNKLKLYGSNTFKIKDMQYGVKEEKFIEIKPNSLSHTVSDKMVHLVWQVLQPDYEPFVDAPFCPMALHAFVIEAFGIPKMDIGSMSDPYVKVKMEEDKIYECTKVIDNTITPQWETQLDVLITNPYGKAVFEIWDKNEKKDKIISSAMIELSEVNDGQVHYKWLKMNGVAKKDQGGNLNVILQCTPIGHPCVTFDDLRLMLYTPNPNQ